MHHKNHKRATRIPKIPDTLASNKAHLEDLAQLSQYVKKLDNTTPILAESYIARWIHLGIRNPEPRQMIWTWKKTAIWTACSIMNRYNTTKIYLVTPDNQEKLQNQLNQSTLCGPYNLTKTKIDIQNIRTSIYKIHLVTLHKKH